MSKKPTCILCGYEKLVLTELNIVGREGATRITDIKLYCPKCDTELSIKGSVGADEQMEDLLKRIKDNSKHKGGAE